MPLERTREGRQRIAEQARELNDAYDLAKCNQKEDEIMAEKYVVIDAEGNVSYDAEKEEPESFAALPAAEKRAKELARSSPGEAVGIYVLNGVAVAPVGAVEIKSPGR